MDADIKHQSHQRVPSSRYFPDRRTRAIWWINDIVMAVPLYGLHVFWFGLFGFVMGGHTGSVIGVLIGLGTSTFVSWIIIHYVQRTRCGVGKALQELSDLERDGIKNAGPIGIGHYNWVAVVCSYLVAMESSLLAIFVVLVLVVLANYSHESYVELRYILDNAVNVFFDHFHYLDNYFNDLAAAGQQERADFVAFGFTCIWIVGFPSAFRVVLGASQGWVLFIRCAKFSYNNISRGQVKGFLMLFISLSVVLLCNREIWNDVEKTFSPYKTGLPRCGLYDYHGFLEYLFVHFPGELMIWPILFVSVFSFLLLLFMNISMRFINKVSRSRS